MLASRQYVDERGHRVTVTIATDRQDGGVNARVVHVMPVNDGADGCAFCAAGACIQEVHTSPTWKRELVVHNHHTRAAAH